MTKTIFIPTITDFPELESVKQTVIRNWKLTDTHGLCHWQRVERNGILLSLEAIENNYYQFRQNVNLRVVRMFAYTHDMCRLNDAVDIEHGERAAQMIHKLRDSLFHFLTDEEISLLEQACRFHTTMHKTDNPTIDICFDADRLDLERVGIIPDPIKTATAQGAFYAAHPKQFKELTLKLLQQEQ